MTEGMIHINPTFSPDGTMLAWQSMGVMVMRLIRTDCLL